MNPDKNTNQVLQAEIEYRLAKAWFIRNNLSRAISGFQSSIKLNDKNPQAFLELGQIYFIQKRHDKALEVFREGLESHPNDDRLHKGLVNATVSCSDLDKTFNFYQLKQASPREIVIQDGEILCCSAVRNEIQRLPFFLNYYRKIGISHFLIIDNQSTDDTPSYLLDQPDVHLFTSGLSFNKANFGAAWFELLLRRYGIGHWVLIVDADEILYYPECETKNLIQLCREMDRSNRKAFEAQQLDMYSDKPIRDTHYVSGEDFREVCPFFDRKNTLSIFEQAGMHNDQTFRYGGVRQRVFGEENEFLLSKVPLVKYEESTILSSGQHLTYCSKDEIASQSGCLLHFKFFASFIEYVSDEVNRKEHFGNARQYKIYSDMISKQPDLTLYDQAHSLKLKNNRQLIKLGFMQSVQPALNRSIFHNSELFPTIHPLENDGFKPTWSVMIPVYERTEFLQKAIESVLSQAIPEKDFQIEVVCDGEAPDKIHKKIKQIVESYKPESVSLHISQTHLGLTGIFNLCLQRARGKWVHVLPDDDWIKPGFYQALGDGIRKEQNIGSAFCRFECVDHRGDTKWVSELELKESGIVTDWLERITVYCRLQFSSIVIRRSVFEELGGFSPLAKTAFDWEMWVRIAVKYPIWFETQPLSVFHLGPTSASYHLINSAEKLKHALAAIEVMSSYLPSDQADIFTRKAKDHYAQQAILNAVEMANRGNYQGAIVNIIQALKCSHSNLVLHELHKTLADIRLTQSKIQDEE